MITNNLEDYEVLSILGKDTSSSCYKVKHKTTSTIQTWRAVVCDKMSREELTSLLEKISKHKEENSSYFVNILGYIHQEDPGIVYLVTDYYNKGSLTDIINYCKQNKKRLCENFIWRVLYQMTFILKTTTTINIHNLQSNKIFVDDCGNIRVLNFQIFKEKSEPIESKLILAQLILSLCTLEVDVKKQDYNVMCDTILNHFSNELVEIISFILMKQTTSDEVFDVILCHPTVLLKSHKPFQEEIYVDIGTDADKNSINDNIKNVNIENSRKGSNNDFRLQLENLKNREILLRNREQKLMEKEYELKKREKKITILEKSMKEKLFRAEVYLKTVQENKTSKSTLSKKIDYEDVDTSFSAACGDSTILPTSSKLDLDKFKKPPVFSRTLSERHVRFKGHSPLKENIYRKNLRSSCSHIDSRKVAADTSSWNSISSEEASEKSFHTRAKDRKKSLFGSFKSRKKSVLKEQNILPNNAEDSKSDDPGVNKSECRPISWTEENKKQAFELLRMMNSTQISSEEANRIKHTHL